MDNKEISGILKLTAQLMELHGENEFKIRSYSNAAFKLGRLDIPLSQMNPDDLETVDGIGKSLAAKVAELLETNNLKFLEELIQKTPEGVIEMLSIKGIGPKKIRTLWQELEVESVGELLYACNENRLVELKGFGAKTQESVKNSIEFILSSAGKFHYAAVEGLALDIVKEVKKIHNTESVSLTGAIRRKCEIIEKIEILAGFNGAINSADLEKDLHIPLNIIQCKPENFFYSLFITSGNEKHLAQFPDNPVLLNEMQNSNSEENIYSLYNSPLIVPEMREGIFEMDWYKNNSGSDLIEMKDLRGILHNHSTYSDGSNSLREMALHCKESGYEYLGICDHSKSASYANGLSVEKVAEQQKEIDMLNKELSPFRIFKGIESDILNDGSLDYPEEVLKTFDFIVASIHSNLKMNEEKATSRLLKAIENPYTTILGHPTGRLLLSREGYPIDHKKIIDACAANGVVIELNAHPYRLDLDWRWIQYALGKSVMISINPDAHNREGYRDMYYGICVARKGGLIKKMTFNAKSRIEMEEYFKKKGNR